jgi:hypothetical protein
MVVRRALDLCGDHWFLITLVVGFIGGTAPCRHKMGHPQLVREFQKEIGWSTCSLRGYAELV